MCILLGTPCFCISARIINNCNSQNIKIQYMVKLKTILMKPQVSSLPGLLTFDPPVGPPSIPSEIRISTTISSELYSISLESIEWELA